MKCCKMYVKCTHILILKRQQELNEEQYKQLPEDEKINIYLILQKQLVLKIMLNLMMLDI